MIGKDGESAEADEQKAGSVFLFKKKLPINSCSDKVRTSDSFAVHVVHSVSKESHDERVHSFLRDSPDAIVHYEFDTIKGHKTAQYIDDILLDMLHDSVMYRSLLTKNFGKRWCDVALQVARKCRFPSEIKLKCGAFVAYIVSIIACSLKFIGDYCIFSASSSGTCLYGSRL